MQKEKEPNMKKVKEPSVTIRCSLASLHDFANLLTSGAKAKVIEIGFQNSLKLPSIRNPLKVTETLMDRARVTDEGRILLPIKDEVDLILEPEDVSLILGIGRAGGQSKELLQANDQSSNVLDKMYSLLKYASDKHGTKKHPKPVHSKDKDDELVQGQEQDETVPGEVQDEDAGAGPGQPAKKHRRDYFCSGSIRALLLAYKNRDKVVQAKLNDDMITKLFCMEVLDKFLLSSSSSTIPSTIQDAVTNLENLKNVDWCTLVYERVKTSIIEWKNSSNKKNRNVTGCIFLLLIPFLDFIKDAEDPNLNLQEIPRINQYNLSMIKRLVGEGMSENFEFNSFNETCYGNRAAILDNHQDQLQLMPTHGDEQRDYPRLYQENVVERTRDKVKLKILGHVVRESVYVDCFKSGGLMHTAIMYLLCELWNRDWEDKLILSQQAVYQLLDPKRGTGKLAEELGPQNPKQANLIFIPVVHDDHWFLIVFSREEDTFYVLDSLPSLSRISTINGIISTLKEHLQQASVGPQYSVKVLPVKRQDNNFDCGFHVLLYIKEFHNRNLICSIDKAMVEKYRMETSIDLVCHPLNESERDEDDHGDDEVIIVGSDKNFLYGDVFNTAVQKERGEQGHSVFNTPVDDHRLPSPTANTPVDDHRLPSPTANTPVDDHWLSSPTGKGTEDLLQHVALDADKKKPVEAEDGEQNHKMLEDNTEAASGKNAEDAKKSVDAADEAEDGEQNQKMLEDNTEAASKAASAKNAEDAKKPVDAADGEQNQKMLEDNTEAAGEEMKKQKAKAAGEEHKPAGGTEAASRKSAEDASSSLKDDRKVEEADKNAAKRNKMRTQGSELEQSKTEDDRKVEEADKNAAKRNKKRTQRSELKQSKTEAAGKEMNKAAKGNKKRTLDSEPKQSTPKMPPGCERKLVSPELPSGCGRQIKRQTSTKDFSDKRIWLNNVVLEDVHDLVKSESKTVLRFADISMTGFELEQSLQGGEGAKKVMEFFMQCLNAEQKIGLKRIFVSPLKKVKGQDDQDLKTKIRDVVPRRKGRGQPCFTTETIIYCPVFIDDEWIVVCFFFTQSKDQIHVCCRSGSYQNVRDFCSTLGESLTDGFRNCGHKVPAFGKKLAHTPTYVEPNDTALASMYFMEKFNGSDEAKIMRLKCNEKEYRDAFIQDYKVGLLPYLMRHKINKATLPDAITKLTERRNKKQKA